MSSENLQKAVEVLGKDMSPVLIEAVTSARDYREAVRHETDDDVETIHATLVINRGMIERLEQLVAHLGFLRSRAAQVVATRKGEYDDAYVASATKKTVGFADYASAKEKDAHFALGTIDQTIALRKAEASYRDVDAAWEFCRTMLRGAEGVQRDMELRIRLISLRSQLER